MKKKTVAAILAVSVLLGGFSGCGVQVENPERKDVSYLYVDAYSGGFGVEFYEAIKPAFEEKYKNESFAEGKMGVVLDISSSANNAGNTFINSIKSTQHDIHVIQSFNYVDYMSDGNLLDITNWVKEILPDGRSIEDKMYDTEKEALTAVDGKYYSLPTFAGFTGFTYDAKVLADNNLYFADSKDTANYPIENSSYTGKEYEGRGFIFNSADKKSPGPDGKYDTYDDGLPSSYEEFFYLFDYMLEMSPRITPFIFRNSHYISYLANSLLNANLTKTELTSNFTFDSGDETVRVVNGFNANGEPVVEQVKINNDNGYLVNRELGKYMMCKFMYHLLTYKNGSSLTYYDSRCEGQTLSNLQVQQVYIESSLDTRQTPIAMLCEGNFWYNEASGSRAAAEELYKDKAKNRSFKYLPLPAKERGTVDENGGTSLTLTDNFANYLIVNGKTARSEEKTKLAKAFIQFMYSDDSLSAMTAASGFPFMFKYEMNESDKAKMDIYQTSLWDAYKQAKDTENFVSTISGNKIFQNHYDRFLMSTLNNFYRAKINGLDYYDFTAFWRTKADAKDWFNGMAISETEWNKTYNIYK